MRRYSKARLQQLGRLRLRRHHVGAVVREDGHKAASDVRVRGYRRALVHLHNHRRTKLVLLLLRSDAALRNEYGQTILDVLHSLSGDDDDNSRTDRSRTTRAGDHPTNGKSGADRRSAKTAT